MTGKIAIFDPKKREKIVGSCETNNEFVVIWLFMNTGMHPKDVKGLKPKNLDDDDWLQWKRAKNAQPRRELLPKDIAIKVRQFLSNKKRPKNRTSYWEICKDIGTRSGIKALSPMSLRHTFCILELKRLQDHPDKLDLVAMKMGCSKKVVMQNYLDLLAWEQRLGI